jgi:hypothetical protein
MNKIALEKKSNALANVIISLSQNYHATNDEEEKSQISIIIGAGLFYLPTSKVLCTGLISRDALMSLQINPKNSLVKEHCFPRKVAANELLTVHLNGLRNDRTLLSHLYTSRFGKYHIVTKKENQKLKKYQKLGVFESEKDSYEKAGIELIDLNDAQNRHLFDEIQGLAKFVNRPTPTFNLN